MRYSSRSYSGGTVIRGGATLVRVGSKNFGNTEAISTTIFTQGGTIIFDEFTITSKKVGADRVQPFNEMLTFAEQQGAKYMTIKGLVINPSIEAKLWQDFEINVPATKQGLIDVLKELRATKVLD